MTPKDIGWWLLETALLVALYACGFVARIWLFVVGRSA